MSFKDPFQPNHAMILYTIWWTDNSVDQSHYESDKEEVYQLAQIWT